MALRKEEVDKEVVVGRVTKEDGDRREAPKPRPVIGIVLNVENQTSLKEMNASVVVNLRGWRTKISWPL